MIKFLSILFALTIHHGPPAWAKSDPLPGSSCQNKTSDLSNDPTEFGKITVYCATNKITKTFSDACNGTSGTKEVDCKELNCSGPLPTLNKTYKKLCPAGTVCIAKDGKCSPVSITPPPPIVGGGSSTVINCSNDTDVGENVFKAGSLDIKLSGPISQEETRYDECDPTDPSQKKLTQYKCITNTFGGDMNAYIEAAKIKSSCEGICSGGICKMVVAECPQCPAGKSCNAATGYCEAVSRGCNADDRDPCTKDFCRGGKRFNVPITFDDGNPCTLDKCINGHEWHDKLNDIACSDGNACTEGDSCLAGTCTSGNTLSCNDKNGCTLDTCSPGVGCAHTPVSDGTLCAGGTSGLCMGGAICQAGACKQVIPPQCDDNDPCTTDFCYPIDGCHHNPAASGTACNDSNICTTGDVCTNGSCAGETECAEGSTCNPTTGECGEVELVEPVPQISKLGVGGYRTCWVKTDGSVSCAGNNIKGQSGQGWADTVCPAHVVEGISNPESLEATAHHNCAILQDTSVVCWGNNESGQVGIDPPNTDKNPTPKPVQMASGGPLTGAVSLATGASHSCAVLQNGQVACWGSNQCGELGNQAVLQSSGEQYNGQPALLNSTPISSKALLVDGISDAVQVSAGNPFGLGQPGFSCALLKSGEVKCWGWYHFAGVGEGSGQFMDSCSGLTIPTPTKVTGIGKALSLSSGGGHSCVIDWQYSQRTVKCWGRNIEHNLGYEFPIGKTSFEAKMVFSGDVAQIAVGYAHSCARLADSRVKCWGGNAQGHLGVPKSTTFSKSPVFVMDPENPQTQMTGAIDLGVANVPSMPNACILTQDHHIKCWGDGKACNATTME